MSILGLLFFTLDDTHIPKNVSRIGMIYSILLFFQKQIFTPYN